MTRLIILGGILDPVRRAHLQIARAVARQFTLGRVISVVPETA